ncbi:MAG TPA: hypothetical protein VKS79_00185 [Gemmataceae bacterium]|nr:hypothetical protein [Gemmataceae bacterium]
MGRIIVILAIGLSLSLAGIALVLSAHELATTWQSLGPNAWGGQTDPGKEANYRALGFGILLFGLLLDAFTAHRWLNNDKDFRTQPSEPVAVD